MDGIFKCTGMLELAARFDVANVVPRPASCPSTENLALYGHVNLHLSCSSLLCMNYFHSNAKINVLHAVAVVM